MNTHPQVSFFRKLYLPASEPRTLEEIIILIRIRHWMHEITAYRNALTAGNVEGARKLKTQLPGFTPSGVFRTGHRADQLETYSHAVGLDFDHVPDPPALARLFREQKYTLGLFISPGGEGLKVFVLVDTDRELHLNAFTAVATWYEQLSGLSCDRVCKDISRCCYVSDDPDAWYNPDAETFVVSALSPVQLFAQEWLHRHPMAEGNRNQTVYRLGCEANRKGFSREEVAAFCIPLLHAPGFTSEEIDQALSSAYEGNKGERSVSPATFRTQKDKKDTGTFSGEDCAATLLFFPGISLTTCRPVDRRCLPRTQPPADDATGGVFSRSRADLSRLFPEDIRTATGAVHPFRPLCIDPGRADKRPHRPPPPLPSGTAVHHPPVSRPLSQNDYPRRLKLWRCPFCPFLSFSLSNAYQSAAYPTTYPATPYIVGGGTL